MTYADSAGLTRGSGMIQTIEAQRSLTFSEFLSYDFPDEGRYELANGNIVRILATRQHDNIAEFITDAFKAEVRRLSLSYRVSGRVMIRTLSPEGQEQGRVPDVSVVDRALWDANLSAYTAFTEPLQIAVEVVSSNWELGRRLHRQAGRISALGYP